MDCAQVSQRRAGRRRTRNDPARGEGGVGSLRSAKAYQRRAGRSKKLSLRCCGEIEWLYRAPAYLTQTQSRGGVDRGEVGEIPPCPLIVFGSAWHGRTHAGRDAETMGSMSR